MDEMLVQIKGAVKHPVMIDPGVWIFDDRRVDMDTVFDEPEKNQTDKEYEAMGRAFDEQRKGALPPQTNENKVTISRKDLTEKSLGIRLAPFMKNAEPEETASMVRLHRKNGKEDIILPAEKAISGIVAFSETGSPLRSSGPLHFYYSDGSNRNEPITHVSGFTFIESKESRN
ncbi:hypothetical protein [Alkalicoccus saliphilus]|uniref:Peptidyl-prolyl cis-trans isomerase n=1 Tax=Alkalicoccus saliphilus TaxID=200989 RepID=A0A2T4U8L8_9BACI|nr:hypothetical protein [Alkalicoccus saliphilus]PTL39739.1 hypothetical protein C6Y45_05325 [Alkalicoccus saliphilus]